MSIEIISAFIGLILTLLVFSYLIGDNPLFRFAIYLFIGVSSGYAATAVWHYVLMPRLFSQLDDINQLILLIIPLILGISLLAKLSPRISWLGNFAMAVLVGRGRGDRGRWSVIGTLLPQAQAAMDVFDPGAQGVQVSFARAVRRDGHVPGHGPDAGILPFHPAGRAADGTVKSNRILDGIGLVRTSLYCHHLRGVVRRSVYGGIDGHDRAPELAHQFHQTTHWSINYACIAGPKRIHSSN
jgi:hypothetical protein